jgi:subtilisin family serine protease
MTRISRLASARAALLACAWLAFAAPATAQSPPWVPGEVLVRFRTGVRTAQRATALSAAHATAIRRYALAGIERLRLEGTSVEDAVARLSADPSVTWAEPNYTWTIDRVPNDPLYGEQWPLQNNGQTQGTVGADIQAEAAWDVTTGDSSLVVGVIDTGIDWVHPDLAANVWTNPGEIPGNGLDDDGDGYVDDVHGYDFVNRDGDPMDDHGHGTHVSGTIAAVGNNGLGIAGVCWRTKIMGLKFLGASGSGNTADAIEALQFAIDHGVRITNNSWGGGPRSQALADMLAAAGASGMLIVVAAGNSGADLDALPSYPSSYPTPEMIVVAATDKNDALASFSDYGRLTVDIGAPGVSILSLWPGNRTATISGTSMAAPHVAGAAAMLLARFPGMAPLEMKDRLMRGADPLPSLATRTVSGGRLDLLRAVGDPDTIPPGAVADLAVATPRSNTLDLVWTATGDDGGAGRAKRYDLRLATAPIDTSNFASATPVTIAPPAAAGTPEHARVYGLAPQTTYWFALRASDEFGNAGEMSNLASGSTLEPPRIALSSAPLQASLRTGESVEQTLTLTNDSQGTLDWHAPPPVLGTAPPVAARAAAHVEAQLPSTTPPAKGEVGPVRAEQVDSAGGPDAFGYRWLDSDAPGGPGYSWVDIAQSGNLVDLSGDDALSSPVPIGFAFPFYGHTYDRVVLCTNGFLSFAGDDHAYGNIPLPSPLAPATLIAPFWDDLTFGYGLRRAYAWTDGARCVVSWIEVPRFADPLSAVTFQVVLEPSGEIRFQYKALAGGGNDCTVGIQDTTGTIGLTVAWDQPYLHDSLAVRLVPLPRWVSVAPDSGTLGPGESARLAVRFDATGLGTETLASAVHVLSNDPAAPDTAVAATLSVTGIPLAKLHATALDFGDLQAGGRDTLALILENSGGAPLAVLGVDAPAPFTPLFSPHVLEPGAFESIPVVCAPATPGSYTGALHVTTDDAAQPVQSVLLTARAVPPPAMALSPSQIFEAAADGIGPLARDRTDNLLVRNTGNSPLHWTASVVQFPTPPPPVVRARGPAIKGAAEPAGALGSGAPDAAGYRWIDSDATGGPAFEWEEISEVGARIFGGADDSTRTGIPLPFAFPFYGDTFTTVNVCTNGFLSFTDGSHPFLNGDLPDTSAGTPRNLIAPWWDDLDLRPVGGVASAWAWFDGTKFIVEWHDVAHFAVGGPYTFEAILWPDGAIDLQYLSMAGGTDQATIGVQNADGTVGSRVAYNAAYVHDRLRVRITRRPDWLRIDRTAGVTPAGGVDTLRVRVTAEGREPGLFHVSGLVRILSDDPLLPLEEIPVQVHFGVAPAPASLVPSRLLAISSAPLVALDVQPPIVGPDIDLTTVTLAGIPARTDTMLWTAPTATLYFDAIDLVPRLPAGSQVTIAFSGMQSTALWFADTVTADVSHATFEAGPPPAYGSGPSLPPVRTGTTVPLAWTPPPGTDHVDVMVSGDGGRHWSALASTRETAFEFVPTVESAATLVELVAVRADTVAASWLSAPFIVWRGEVPQVGAAAPPREAALRLIDARPGVLPLRLEWAMPAAGASRVAIYDVRGARVRVLANGPLAAGWHLLAWDGRADHGGAAAPGVYFVRAEALGRSLTRRIVVIR